MHTYFSGRLYVTGRVVAIDASMSLYQFLIAVRTGDGVLTSTDGETTRWRMYLMLIRGNTNFLLHFFLSARSHLVGFFYRTIRMVENGIKPVYVVTCKCI